MAYFCELNGFKATSDFLPQFFHWTFLTLGIFFDALVLRVDFSENLVKSSSFSELEFFFSLRIQEKFQRNFKASYVVEF